MAHLLLCPVTLTEACAYVARHHRHHQPPQGGLFAVAVAQDLGDGADPAIVGVAIIGQPVARHRADGWTAEVTRCCTDGTPHVASKLYAAAWRAARALGYRRLITYTLTREPGTSLVAAGWRVVGVTKDTRGWDRAGRPRVDTHPLGQKRLWEAANE